MSHQTKGVLLDDFFEIRTLNINSQELEASITLNTIHPVFKGHFPGNPIVPGVTMIQILKELLSEEFRCSLFLSRIINAKFMAILNPKKTPNVLVKIKTKELEGHKGWKVQGSISEAKTTYFKFTGEFLKSD